MPILTPDDLAPFADIDPAKAAAMIDDAEATAIGIAPCLATLDPTSNGYRVAKAILRSAVLRRNDAGLGARERVDHGPFAWTVDNRAPQRNMFTAAEIRDLERVCGITRRRAFSRDLTPVQEPLPGVIHP